MKALVILGIICFLVGCGHQEPNDNQTASIATTPTPTPTAISTAQYDVTSCPSGTFLYEQWSLLDPQCSCASEGEFGFELGPSIKCP